jgi:RND family efflux transporter MFP subunit
MRGLARFTLTMALIAGPSLAAMLAPSAALAQGRPAGVSTQFVDVQTTSETIPVFGEIVSGRESAVAARVAGVAAEMPLSVGDRVRKGDVLARLDTELLDIELAQAQAEIAIAEAGIAVADAQLDRAEKALRRAESLRANSTIAEAQLEERFSDYAEAIGSRQQAVARIKAAQNALRQADYRLTNATVYAPFDAVVLQVSTEIGQFISAGSQVATLIDLDAMEVEANVPARFVQALRPDLTVAARTDAGGALGLSLRAILPTEFAATRTRPVRFRIDAGDATAAVGQSVTLEIPVSAPRDVIVVPKDALVQARDGWSVFLHVDGKAQPRTVEIGAALESGFEVLSGVQQGDEVVVRGNERLRPGQDIAPMNAAPPSPPAAAPTAAPAAASAEQTSEGQG